MASATVASSDGYRFDLSVERGRLSFLKDFATETKQFGEHQQYCYLTVKGFARPLLATYDPIRSKSVELVGVQPIAFQPTAASNLAIFVWPDSQVHQFTNEELLKAFGDVISGLAIGPFEEARRKAEDLIAPWPVPRRNPELTDHQQSRRELGELRRDALVIVKEGNQKRYFSKYKEVFEDLALWGYLKRTESGILRKSVTYELAPKGYEAIARRIDLTYLKDY